MKLRKLGKKQAIIAISAGVVVLGGSGFAVAASRYPSHRAASVVVASSSTPSVGSTPSVSRTSATPTPTPTPTLTPTSTPVVAAPAAAAAPATTKQTTQAAQRQAATPAATATRPVSAGLASLVAQSPSAQRTDQILGVVASGSSATIHLFDKQSDGTWIDALTASGHVGSAGVGQASESSTATPRGSWPLIAAFGIAANPGALLPWRQVDQNSCYISDDTDPQYNTWQERSTCNSPNEHMITQSVPYQYGIIIGYNTARTPGAGSAFFVHVDDGMATNGCVSVPQPAMVALLQTIHSGALIVNVTSTAELADY